MFVTGQQATIMLQGLAGKPEVLNAVTMLPSGGLNLGGKAAENASGRAVDVEERLAFEAPERSQPLLADSRIESDFGTEAQLSKSYRRHKNGFAVGQRVHIGGGQNAPLHIDPHARVDQECHGSRRPLSSRSPFLRPLRLSASHVAAAPLVRVR